MLIWTDVETTGLDENTCTILEIAAIATDDALSVLGTFHVITDEAKRIPLGSLDPYVAKMHMNNGLWLESCFASASIARADENFATWLDAVIEAHAGSVDGKVIALAPQLAGSTISFDRAFLKKRCPSAHMRLHYRNLDVSTINEIARRVWPDVWVGRPGANRKPEDAKHRAFEDISASIDVLRYYLREIGPMGLS
jgi:oligoribonuclease